MGNGTIKYNSKDIPAGEIKQTKAIGNNVYQWKLSIKSIYI